MGKPSAELKSPRQIPRALKERQEPSRKSNRKSKRVYDDLDDNKPKQVFEKQKKVQYSRSALGRPRKHPKEVDSGDGDAAPKTPKKRGRPKKVAKQPDNTPTSSEEVVPRVPKKRGRPKKVATVSLDMEGSEGSVKRSGSVDEVVPPKKRGRPKKVASITTEVVSEKDSRHHS